MRNATSVIVPDDILNYILCAFNKNEKRSHKTGCSSFIHDFTRALNRFINSNDKRFPLLKIKFCYGVSNDHIKRAFNFKSPHGATRDLRNALALYASDAGCNWNQLIEKHFPLHILLLDKPDAHGTGHPQHVSINDVYNLLVEIKQCLPKK